jgi:branched-chain amino acid transport system permease protein
MNLGMFIAGVIIVIAIYAIQALALNVKFGSLGLLDLGLVGYFAVGAYAFVLVTAPPPGAGMSYAIGLGWPLWAGFIISPIVTAVFALIVGLPALRLSGEYLAIATYAFAEVLRAIFTNETWLSNGVRGFSDLKQPFRDSFASGTAYQYFYMGLCLVVLLLIYLGLSRISWGPFGRSLRAIRENETVALSVGKNVTRMKIKAFILGGAVSAIAASLYVTYATIIVPTMFVPDMTWVVWIILTIGGAGNYKGMIVGAAVLITAQESTRFIQATATLAPKLAAARFIVMGLILILIIRFRPRGILPEKPWIDRSPVPAPKSTASLATEAAKQVPAGDTTAV